MANLDLAYDLTLDEARRRSAVLEAIGDDWDPIAVLAEEEKAYDMLYSGLDEEQQRVYDELVTGGVLPDRTVTRVTDCPDRRHCPTRLAAVPRLQPRGGLRRLRQRAQLRHALAIPIEQQGHAYSSAVPRLRAPVVGRHAQARPQAVRRRLTPGLSGPCLYMVGGS